MKNNNKTNNIKEIIQLIIGLIIIAFIGYVIILISIYFIKGIKILFDNYTAIAVALVTGTMAFLSSIIAKVIEKKQIINNQIRSERQEIYTQFLDWLINSLLYGNIKNNDSLVDDIRKYQKLMTIYGSDKVFKAWKEYKDVTIHTVLNRKDISRDEKMNIYVKNEAIYLEKLLLAIRRDLGYKNTSIKQFDILKLYIDDIDKYI